MQTPVHQERRMSADRRRARKPRFLERRSGFDRRDPGLILYTMRERPWILLSVLVIMNLLSLADGALTLVEIEAGIATEGNPVLAALLGAHPLAAAAFKVGIVAAVSIAIWHGRRLRSMLALSIVACGAFAAVIAYHLGSLYGYGLI